MNDTVGLPRHVFLPPAIAAVLPPETHRALEHLCEVSAASDTPLYIVGGLVRDYLLSNRSHAAADPEGPSDIDLAVGGDPESIIRAAAHLGAQATAHDRFGTMTIALDGGARIDIARTRRERYPSAAALPLVEPAPIAEDLKRRDFTINAAAYGLVGPHAGDLIDPDGAQTDMAARRIRILHPDSFRDDPTRLIRAVRYAARIGGALSPDTERAAKRDRRHLAALSPARFGDAWRLLLSEPEAQTSLALARGLELPQSRLPGWRLSPEGMRITTSPEHHWAAIGLTEPNPDIAAALPQAAHLRREERLALEWGRRLSWTRLPAAMSEVADHLDRAPISVVEAAAQVWSGDDAKHAEEWLRRRHDVKSPLTGNNLMELGAPRGPAVGRWLRYLRGAVWDGQLTPADPASVATARRWVLSSPDQPPDPRTTKPRP